MTDIRLQNIRVENPASPLVISRGKVLFENTSSSVSASDSAVIIRGGLSINSTEDSTSLLNGGSLTIAGGMSVAKKIFMGDEVNLDNEYASLRIHGIVKERLKIDTVTNKRITMAPDGLTNVFDVTDERLVLYHTQPSVDFTDGSLVLYGGITVLSTNGNSLMTNGDIVSNNNAIIRKSVSINSATLSNYPLFIGQNTSGESILSQGRLFIQNSIDAASYDQNGAVNIMGGATVAKKMYIGDSCIIRNLLENENTFIRGTEDAFNLTSGSLRLNGGASITKNLVVGNDLIVDNNTFTVSSGSNKVGINTNSPSYELDVFGSVRGTDLYLKNTQGALSLSNGGALTIQGGASVSKNMIIGDGLYVIDGNIGLGINNAVSKLDINGSVTLRGETSGFNPNSEVDIANRQQTYIAFASNGSENDWAYLRQIGGVDEIMLTLDFHNGSTDAGFQIRDINSSLNPDAVPETRLLVARGGNIGIGTNNATSKLDIVNKTEKLSLKLRQNSGFFEAGVAYDNGDYSLNAYSGDTVLKSSKQLHLVSGNGNAMLSVQTSGNIKVNTASMVIGNSSYVNDQGLWMQWNRSGTQGESWLINQKGAGTGVGGVVFGSSNTENVVTELMRISETGNVGINTSAPNSKLHVIGNGTTSALFMTGNVGIDNALPIYKLDINGNVRIEKEVLFNDTRDSTSRTTASLSILGGMSVNKNINVYDNRESLNASTGSLVCYGGVSIVNTQDSSSLTQGGSLTVSGGISVEKTIRSNRLLISSTEGALNNTTGSLITSGGIVIQNSTDAINLLNGGSLLTRGGASIGGKTFHGSDVYMHKSMVFWQNDETELIKMFDNINSIQKWSIGKSSSPEDNFYIQRHNILTGQSVEKVIEITTNGVTKFNNNTASSNKDSSSVVFSGGLSIKNETNSVNTSQGGALTIAGGLSVAKNVYMGGILTNTNTTQSISTATGALVVTGGIGLGGNINVGGNATITGNLTVLGTSTNVNTTNVTVKDNIFLLNSGPGGTSDSGLLIERYQLPNDFAQGDVVNDVKPVFRDISLQLQSNLQNNQIRFPSNPIELQVLLDDYYVGWWIKINEPSRAAGQVRKIIAYNSSTNIATVDQVWTGNAPAAGDSINLYNKSYVGLIFDETNNIFSFSSIASFNDQRGFLSDTSDMPLRMSFGLITDKTTSNSSTGCFNLMGGMTILNTTDAVSITSGGALTINGGASIAKKLHVGQELIVNGVAITPSTGDIQREQTFVSTSSSGSIIGLGFSSNITRSFDVFCSVIVNAASSLYANFHLRGINKGTSWEIASSYVGDETGVVFYIDSFGQVQFTRSSYIGFVNVTFKFKAVTIGV